MVTAVVADLDAGADRENFGGLAASGAW